jgi:hypothetical protein
VERLKRLEILAAEKEYRRMVRNVDHEISEQDRLTDIRELKVRLAAPAMLTIASVLLFGDLRPSSHWPVVAGARCTRRVCTVNVTTAPGLSRDGLVIHVRSPTFLSFVATQSVKQQAIMFMNLVLSFAGVWAFAYYALHATFETQGMVWKEQILLPGQSHFESVVYIYLSIANCTSASIGGYSGGSDCAGCRDLVVLKNGDFPRRGAEETGGA